MELKYEDITNEQWKIYRAVENACLKEDLQEVLQNQYNTNLDKLDTESVNLILEKFEDLKSEDDCWRERMQNAINSILDLGKGENKDEDRRNN